MKSVFYERQQARPAQAAWREGEGADGQGPRVSERGGNEIGRRKTKGKMYFSEGTNGHGLVGLTMVATARCR
jgi:hypothetical protein